MEAVLGGRVDSRLVGAVEGDAAGSLGAGVGGLLAEQVAAGSTQAEAGRARTGGGQQAAAGYRAHRGSGSVGVGC